MIRRKDERSMKPKHHRHVSQQLYVITWVHCGVRCVRGFEPLIVAVHSYLDVRLDDDEVADLAVKCLDGIEWFSDIACHEPDFIIR